MTLAELLIASGITVLLVTTLAFLYIYHLKAFAGLENYMNLNNESRHALDQMTKEIRQADSLVFCSPAKLTFKVGGTNVSFTYDSAQKMLVRSTGGSKDKVILNGCDYWTNNIYDRNLHLITTVTNCKVVQLTWICTRQILGRKVNSEDVQSAKIVIRK